MAFESAVVYANISSGATSVDFTEAGFGTPDAAIILFCRSNGSSPAKTSEPHNMSLGFWDGTRIRCLTWFDSDNEATSRTNTHCSNSAMIMNGLFSGDSEHSVSNITNGIRLTKVGSNSIANLGCTVLLIKGVTNAYVNDATPEQTSGNTLNVTAPGFQPDLLFCIGGNNQFVSGRGTLQDPAEFFISMIARDGASFKNRSTSWGSLNGGGTTNQQHEINDNDQMSEVDVFNLQGKDFAGFTASGFDVLSTSTEASADRDFCYLAIQLDTGDKADVFSLNTPGTTGNQSASGLSITPNTLLSFITKGSVFQNRYQNTNAENIGLAFYDTPGDAASAQGMSEDGVTNTNTATAQDNAAFAKYDISTASVRTRNTLVSYDSDGFTVNWDTTLGSADDLFTGIAIGPEVATTPTNRRAVLRGVNRGILRGVL